LELQKKIRVRKVPIAACLMVGLLFMGITVAHAQDDVNAQILQIKQQLTEMDGLKERLAELEKKLDEMNKAQATSSPTVFTAFKGAKAKIDGRMFVGTLGSQRNGSDPNWSTDIPDAKIRFTFNPTSNITIVNRLSTSGAQAAGFDYFYLDYAGLPGSGTTARLGQRKIDVGQETWTDNPIEGILISNSISHVSGYGIGTALLGKLGTSKLAPRYEVGFVNGPKGVTVRPSTGLPVNFKIGKPLSTRFFASASYFQTGALNGIDASAISVAEISTAPTGAAKWDRKLFELDLRYNYGLAGNNSVIPSAGLPKAMFGATWGSFNDNVVGTSDRKGDYWFVEGLYNLTSKFYAAGRYSTINLGDSQLAKLGKSPVAVNAYRRTSLGLGYRLTDLTDLKAEYSINDTTGGAFKPALNGWSFGVATKF
jgi:hypothetical protein